MSWFDFLSLFGNPVKKKCLDSLSEHPLLFV